MAPRKTATQKAAEYAATQAAAKELAKLKQRRERAEATLDVIDEQIAEAELALRPQEPEVTPDNPNPVIAFSKGYHSRQGCHSRTYSYAAIRCGDSWYYTQNGWGGNQIPRMSWERLLEWLGKSNWDTIERLR